MSSGVARREVDLEAYGGRLEARLGRGWELMRTVITKAQGDPKRVVFGEGEEPTVKDRLLDAGDDLQMI